MNMELFKHQKTGIDFLKEKKRAILADEMGLGKTLQAIMAAHETSGGALVVCQASTKINWKREIERALSSEKAEIMSTTEELKRPRDTHWFIVNYDILEKKMKTIELLIDAGAIDTLILDEAQSIKGKSLRAACVVGGTFSSKGAGKIKMQGIAGKMRQVYCLTGTPIMNRPIELFNQLKAIGHSLSSNRAEFAKRYCGAFTMVQVMNIETGKKFMTDQNKAYQYYGDRTKWKHTMRFLNEQGATNLDELRKKVGDAILRRKKKDVLDLPDKIVSMVECEMREDWRKSYDTAWQAYLDFLNGSMIMDEEGKKKMENILSARSLVEIQKLKQIASLSKVEKIVEDVKRAVESEQKVIIFSQYTETIRMICAQLADAGISQAALTGADDMDTRQRNIDAFQNDANTKAFVANIKAGGVGITLTAASIVMFADMDWSPEIHAQAEDRAHRIGQEGTVNVNYYVSEGTIDEDIVAILAEKKSEISQVIDGVKKTAKTGSLMDAFARRIADRSIHRQP